MLDDLRRVAARERTSRALARLQRDCRQVLSETGELGELSVVRGLVERLDRLHDDELGPFFTFLAGELSPDPAAVLRCAEAYAREPRAAGTLQALIEAVEPPRQELFRRINRTPGGTAAILRLRRALLARLRDEPALAAIEADLLHLLTSWFNPGFLQMRRVDWNSPAQLLEKIIRHEAVHAIDGWDDLRRRLQPDRRCFAFVHPQLPDEPLIFVEVALLPEMPAAIGPLIDKLATPLPPDRFRVAAFYSISNCEPGLRGVSLGNFLIKHVATRLQQELPRLRTFCTLSPIPGFAAWLLGGPDFDALALPRAGHARELAAARATLQDAAGGELATLQTATGLGRLDAAGERALLALGSAYLTYVSPTPRGDPVARFHLDNGARLERLNPRADLSAKGLRQSMGLMVNYLYDLDRVERSHTQFREGSVARSRAVAALG